MRALILESAKRVSSKALVGTFWLVSASAGAFAAGGLRSEMPDRQLSCGNDQVTMILIFDHSARTMLISLNGAPVRSVRITWVGDRGEVPLEDLAEPGVFERRGRKFFYEGLPCRPLK